MATKTATAARDRESKEKIAANELREKKRQFEKSHKLAEKLANYEGLEKSSKVVKNISQAAYGKGGLMSAMSNDPSWYKKFGLNNYSVSLPTFYRLGTQLRPEWRTMDTYDTVPGIATITFIPTLPNAIPKNVPGNTDYKYSPINQSLTRFMAELRKLNSRIGDYDPSDIGLYWYAISGVIFKLGVLSKALKGYNTYYSTNRYLSKAFIRSCGFDPDDFFAHVPEYKAALMRWISIFNANAVIPESLDLIKRYFWLSTVVVKDHKGDQSQLYHFVCPCRVSMNDDETYVAITLEGGDYQYATFLTGIDLLIQRLFNSAGVVTITADLRAAFPDNKLLKFPEFKSDDQLQYSESMHDLEQIHNLKTMPMDTGSYTFGEEAASVNAPYVGSQMSRMNIIVDNDGYLAQGALSSGNLLPMVYGVKCTNERLMQPYAGIENHFLNFYDSEFISDDSILEATRLRHVLHPYNNTWSGSALKYNGTEVVLEIILTTLSTDSDTVILNSVWTDTDYKTAVGIPYAYDLVSLAAVTTFDWFPVCKFYESDDEEFLFTFGEIDHAVAISNDNLRVIHEGCAFSLFFVDTFAKGYVA